MQERMIKMGHAEYKKAEFNGVNESGFVPFGDRVLILPDEASDTTSGNVALPEQMVERMSMASETGVIVALGDGCFRWNGDKATQLIGAKPKVGDRIFMERYAGQLLTGKDGRRYRVIEDRSIGAIQV